MRSQDTKKYWGDGLVLVCSSCLKGVKKKHSEEIKSTLKKALHDAEDEHGIELRQVKVDCLGICPSDGVSCGLVSAGASTPECWVIDEETSKKELKEHIIKVCGEKKETP